ncbi:MAG: phytanoyl-CoA dioxygenase family protein [Planctomycetes bacterium]|nr:phytanoyl-CoA dioxygenase family protein [Planctomycetota bacterium]
MPVPDSTVEVQTPQWCSLDEVAQFWRDGFLCVRGLASPDDVTHMRRVADTGVREQIGPVEYEAELHYPGAPVSLDADGGRTIRRLKQALSRDFRFIEWMIRPEVLGRLQQLLGTQVVCPLAHHNCIMTKQPQFSSETGWHQDIRYWSFARPELINAWIALGREHAANGCLQVIPGSHRLEFDRCRFDADVFFRPDLPENQALIQTRQFVELEPGDVLLFHCKTLHAASRNSTSESKYSAVFTFRGADCPPISGTRSAALPELLLTPGR